MKRRNTDENGRVKTRIKTQTFCCREKAASAANTNTAPLADDADFLDFLSRRRPSAFVY